MTLIWTALFVKVLKDVYIRLRVNETLGVGAFMTQLVGFFFAKVFSFIYS